jgi:hypothetical protein
MLSFFRRINRPHRTRNFYLPDGLLRRALAEGYGHAEPAAGGWARLVRRMESAHAPVGGFEPVFYDHGGAGARTGVAAALLSLEATGLAWRLPWRSSLAACPLF